MIWNIIKFSVEKADLTGKVNCIFFVDIVNWFVIMILMRVNVIFSWRKWNVINVLIGHKWINCFFWDFTFSSIIYLLFLTESSLFKITGSSPSEMFSGKGVLKICRKFTREHPCQSVTFFEEHLWRTTSKWFYNSFFFMKIFRNFYGFSICKTVEI